MSYRTQAILSQNDQLLMRIAACASTQGIPGPVGWVYERQWEFSAQQGWDTAFSAALTSNTANPGNQETIITDAMILTAVKALKAVAAP